MFRKILACLLAAALLAGCSGKPAAESAPAPTAQTESLQECYNQGFRDGYVQGLDSAVPENPGTRIPKGFVSISEAVPDVILEIRYYSTYNFVGERIEGYEAPEAILTEEAALALREVSDELLAQGYRLKVYDAYRPQRAVDHFVRWAEDGEAQSMKPFFYPEVDKEELFSRGYIAARSGHSRGSTVDLTLFDMETGHDADMGGTFDYFGSSSHADCRGTLTEEQLANRQLLRQTMENHGFRGIPTEWWHFTLRNEPYPGTYFDFPVTE